MKSSSKPATIEEISKLLDQKLEQKLEEKLNQKFDEKLAPIQHQLTNLAGEVIFIRTDLESVKATVNATAERVDNLEQKVDVLNQKVDSLEQRTSTGFQRVEERFSSLKNIIDQKIEDHRSAFEHKIFAS